MTAVTETGLEVTPLSGWTGAVISGVDLSAPLTADELAGIRAALYKWKVVFFRDQSLDHSDQITFGAQFGDVTPGHPYEGDSAPEGFPEIHTVSPAAYNHRYGPKRTGRLRQPGFHTRDRRPFAAREQAHPGFVVRADRPP
jgi:alpha-ketoglutarate-dependent sulfate ester dioxygenase